MSEKFGPDWKKMGWLRAQSLMEVMIAIDERSSAPAPKAQGGIDGREQFR